MKLFRKRRKNNRGFSLVEVICAIAIMSLTSTAIGSAMVMSTKNYQRGNAEVDVQKEAQTTTNLIGNLLVGANHVDEDETEIDGVIYTTKLTIDGEGVTYELDYDPDTGVINYTESRSDGTVLTGVLAENVSDFNIGDLTDFDANRNVKVDLAVDKNGKSYDASYNTTARNVKANSVGAVESAVIMCETDIVLEPGQLGFELPVQIQGNPSTPGFNWSELIVAGADSEVGDTSDVTASPDGVYIQLDKAAKGILSFTLSTNAKKNEPGIGEIPLDTKTVTVRVRRADRISYIKTATDDLKKDCIYRIYATVGSDHIANFDKVIGKAYDDDYINPRHVQFDIDSTDGALYDVIGRNEDCDNPYVDIKLKEDLPQGEKITVTMLSKHAFGINKTMSAYDTGVKEVCEIKNAQQAIVQDSGIRRGDDSFVEFHHNIDIAGISSAYKGDPNYLTNYGKYMFRYRVKGTTANSPYYRMNQDSISNQKFNAIETWLWKAGLAYEIDVIMVGIDDRDKANPVMWFPQDDALLAELQATYPGITKGWTDADEAKPEACTQFGQYGGTLEVGAAVMKWKDDSGNYIESIGSESNHQGLIFSVSDSVGKMLNFDGVNMKAGHYSPNSYLADFYVWIPGEGGAVGTWQLLTNPGNYFEYKFGNMDLTIQKIFSPAAGKEFKIVPKLKDTYKEITSATLTNISYSGEIVDGNTIYELAVKETGQGCVYFKVN